MRLAGAIAAGVAAVLVCAGSAHAFDPVREAANVAKSGEREQVWLQPGYQVQLGLESQRTQTEAALTAARDPERNFLTDLCNSKGLACAGDIRLNHWKADGHGLVERVLWTARNGSTVAGRVWATRAGARKRPAIVITNGSIQASEELYWYAAQTLAKAGYVVVTFDPQMQGLSDTYGEGGDRNEGFPSQTAGNTFYDWTQDAIDFLLSTPAKPFCARAEPLGHQPLPQAGPARQGGAERRLQPHVEAGRGPPDRHRRALLRRLGRQLDGPAGQARGRGRGLGQPVRPRAGPRDRHAAGGQGLLGRRDRAAAGPPRALAGPDGGQHRRRAAHLRPRPAGQERRLARLQQGRRGHRLAGHPRRHPLRLLLHPDAAVPGHAARRRSDRLVHPRLVRPLRQGGPGGRPPAAVHALAQRPRRPPRRSRGRGQPVLVLLPLAPGLPHHRRQAVRVRGPALGLPRPGGRRRRPGRVLLPGRGAHRRPPARAPAAGAGLAERRPDRRAARCACGPA